MSFVICHLNIVTKLPKKKNHTIFIRTCLFVRIKFFNCYIRLKMACALFIAQHIFMTYKIENFKKIFAELLQWIAHLSSFNEKKNMVELDSLAL